MSDGLNALSKHNNSTFIMLYLYHKMDVNYLVVKDCLIPMLFDHNCMFGIGADDNYSNMAKTCLKVLQVNCCRLNSLYHLKHWHV
jgi:hypothetical protein